MSRIIFYNTIIIIHLVVLGCLALNTFVFKLEISVGSSLMNVLLSLIYLLIYAKTKLVIISAGE